MDSKTRFAAFLCICFMFALISEPGSASKSRSKSESSSSSEEEIGSGEETTMIPKSSTKSETTRNTIDSSTSSDEGTKAISTTRKVASTSSISDENESKSSATTRKLASTSSTSSDNESGEITENDVGDSPTSDGNETTSSDIMRKLDIVTQTPDESSSKAPKIFLWILLYCCACMMIIFAYRLRHHPCIASIRARRCWGGITTYKKLCFESTHSLDIPSNQGVDEDSDSDVHYDLAKQKLEGMGQSQIIDKVRREVDTKEQVYESLGGNIPITIPGSKPSGVGRGHGCPIPYHKPGAAKNSPAVFHIGETVV